MTLAHEVQGKGSEWLEVLLEIGGGKGRRCYQAGEGRGRASHWRGSP
jgi:hypothetical protein